MTRDQSNDDRGTGRIEAFSDGVIAVAIYILIDLMYGLPIRFLRFGSPDIFSVGAQEAPEGHLPHAHAKNELPEVDREPE